MKIHTHVNICRHANLCACMHCPHRCKQRQTCAFKVTLGTHALDAIKGVDRSMIQGYDGITLCDTLVVLTCAHWD